MIKILTNREKEFMDIGWQDFCLREDLIMFMESQHSLAIDTETTGMSFMGSELISIQIGNSEKAFIIDCQYYDYDFIKPYLEEKEIILQNAGFDLPFLYAQNIIPNKVYDTLLAEIILSLGVLNYKRDLGTLVKRYLDIDIDKSMQKEIQNVGLLDMEAIEYSAKDVMYLHHIKDKQIELLEKRGNKRALDLENEFVKVLAYVEFCGIYFDKEAWLRVARENEYYEYGAWLKLRQYVEDNLDIDPDEINFDSQQQVIPIFKKLGIDIYDEKEMRDSLNKDFLAKRKHPFVDLFLDYKKRAKAVSTYGRNWFDFPFEDNRIHTKFRQLVATGRMACGNVNKGPFPNIQNLIRDKAVRASFKGERANVLITCDYSGQESVVLADKAKEPALLKFYLEGEADLHSYVAQQIWKDELGDLSLAEIKEHHSEKRQLAKSANFAISFGGSGYTIANNLNIAPEEGERVFQAFMKAFPKLNKYFDETSKAALDKGYILINERTGLKRYIEGMREYKKRKGVDKKFEGMIYRKSLNTPVQATAAQITKTACIYFYNWIIENKRFGKTKIVNIVHDEIVVEENGRKAEETAKALQECMEKAGRVFLTTLPLKAEPEIDKVWVK